MRAYGWFECKACHAVLAGFFALLLIPVAMLTQPLWSPFDDCKVETVSVQDNQVQVLWDCLVYKRYPAVFTSRLVHTSTGTATTPRTWPPSTGKVGRFNVLVSAELPENPLPGQWCYVVEGRIQYDWVTRARSYPPACIEVE